MFKLKRRVTGFRDQEDGLVMTEFLILLPLLIWTFMALFVYWDAFRTINQSQKASFAVSDLLSRQSEVDTSFISGMKTVMQYLTGETDVRVRITSIQWLEPENEYYVLFSRSPGVISPSRLARHMSRWMSRRRSLNRSSARSN